MVAWESPLERDAILLLEYSSGVSFFREQPQLVRYIDGDSIRDYYPDFEIVLEDGCLIHLEIKTNTQLQKPKIAAKFAAIARHYQRAGREFRIASEDVIRREPLLSNTRTLACLARHWRPDDSKQSIQGLFSSGALPFNIVEASLGREYLLRLIAVGCLHCDLTRPLTGDNPVEIPKGGRHATCLL